MSKEKILLNNVGLTFGEMLRLLREANKLTQQELGIQLGVRKQTISNWEKENVYPPIEQVLKMANIFNCTLDYMFSRTVEYKINTYGLKDEQIEILSSIVKEFKKYNELEKLENNE